MGKAELALAAETVCQAGATMLVGEPVLQGVAYSLVMVECHLVDVVL